MSWLQYSNQGATRNQQLSPELVQALSFLPELGVSVDVFSGGQPGIDEGGPRVGSVRHDHGNAADVFFSKDGRRLDWANPDDQPIFQDIVSRARANGITGIGAGDGYMQPGSMHIGFGKEAVWGAGGKGANAPDWLRSAYYGGNSPAPVADPRVPQAGSQGEYRTGQHRTDPNYAGVDFTNGQEAMQSLLSQIFAAPQRSPQPGTIADPNFSTSNHSTANFLTNALAPKTQTQDPRNFLNKMTFGA